MVVPSLTFGNTTERSTATYKKSDEFHRSFIFIKIMYYVYILYSVSVDNYEIVLVYSTPSPSETIVLRYLPFLRYKNTVEEYEFNSPSAHRR